MVSPKTTGRINWTLVIAIVGMLATAFIYYGSVVQMVSNKVDTTEFRECHEDLEARVYMASERLTAVEHDADNHIKAAEDKMERVLVVLDRLEAKMDRYQTSGHGP